MVITGHYRIRGGTDAQRAAATTVHAREIHFTNGDRKELWVGTLMIGGKGYHKVAINPGSGGYTSSTTLNFPAWYRNHLGKVVPVEHSGDYTHTLILPVASPAPRDGDEAGLFVELPACAAHTITLQVRNASVSGTVLATLATAVGGAARKWRLQFGVVDGAWELHAAQELLLS